MYPTLNWDDEINGKTITTKWLDAQDLLPRLSEGDLVEFRRAGVFSHWGVFIQEEEGVGYIAHLSSVESDGLRCLSAVDWIKLSVSELWNKVTPTLLSKIVEVRVDDLLTVASGSRCRVNNSGDYYFTPFPAEEIVARAVSDLGRQKYHLLFTNCEHFASWCRGGSKSSDQASYVKSLAIGGIVQYVSGSTTKGAAVGVGCLAVCSFFDQLRNQISRRFEMDW